MNIPKILEKTPEGSIQLLTADSNYTIMTLINGKRIISGYSLNVFAELFDEHTFIRVDRSNLVNRHFILNTLPNGSIVLQNHKVLVIPRRRKAGLFSQYPNLFSNPLITL